MFKNLATLALLKTIASYQKNTFIELLIPFFATLIHKKQYDEIDIYEFLEDFKNEFSINIPYHTIVFVLNKSKNVSLVTQKENKYYTDLKIAKELSIQPQLIENTKEYDKLIDLLNNYIDSENYTNYLGRAEELLIYFYKKMNYDYFNEIIINGSAVVEQDINKEKLYIVAKFLIGLKNENTKYHTLAVDIYIGYLLTKTFQIDDIDKYNQPLKGLTVYIDTKFFLNLLGVEDENLAIVYVEYLKLLKNNNICLKIFEHTQSEILNILHICLENIDTYNDERAIPLLRSYYYGNKNRDHILNDIALFKQYLEDYSIEVQEVEYLEAQNKYQIDSKLLHSKIEDIFKSSGNTSYKKSPQMIFNDVKSVEYIYKLRQGKKPTSLKNSTAIFITSNGALVKAVREFDPSNSSYISPCLHEAFFNTLLWVQNRNIAAQFSEIKFMLECASILKPDTSFKRKFYQEIDKLTKTCATSPYNLNLLKSEQVLDIVFNQSQGNEQIISDESIQEAFHKSISNAKAEGIKEAQNMNDDKINKKINNCASFLYKVFNMFLASIITVVCIFLYNKYESVYNYVQIVSSGIAFGGFSIIFLLRKKIRNMSKSFCKRIFE